MYLLAIFFSHNFPTKTLLFPLPDMTPGEDSRPASSADPCGTLADLPGDMRGTDAHPSCVPSSLALGRAGTPRTCHPVEGSTRARAQHDAPQHHTRPWWSGSAHGGAKDVTGEKRPHFSGTSGTLTAAGILYLRRPGENKLSKRRLVQNSAVGGGGRRV